MSIKELKEFAAARQFEAEMEAFAWKIVARTLSEEPTVKKTRPRKPMEIYQQFVKELKNDQADD